MGGDFA